MCRQQPLLVLEEFDHFPLRSGVPSARGSPSGDLRRDRQGKSCSRTRIDLVQTSAARPESSDQQIAFRTESDLFESFSSRLFIQSLEYRLGVRRAPDPQRRLRYRQDEVSRDRRAKSSASLDAPGPSRSGRQNFQGNATGRYLSQQGLQCDTRRNAARSRRTAPRGPTSTERTRITRCGAPTAFRASNSISTSLTRTTLRPFMSITC